MNKNNNQTNLKDLKRIFNMNSILSQILNWSAYFVLIGSACILIYISFIDKLTTSTDWRVLTLFSVATLLLVWTNWNTFYRKEYEKTMNADIENAENDKSIHNNYKNAIAKWTDEELQLAIDEFNKDYEQKWLNYVERITGVPIETCWKVELDAKGKPILDENGEPKQIQVLGIKDRPYKGFKHKILMWRIKHHKYPQSGYKSSLQLMSLLSFRENNINRRDLKASSNFFVRKSLGKFVTFLMVICLGGSVAPELIHGDYAAALLRLLIALGSLGSSVIFGAINGVRGAKIKLSIVDDATFDMELWDKKYHHNYVVTEQPILKEPETLNEKEPETPQNVATEKLEEIFNTNFQKS